MPFFFHPNVTVPFYLFKSHQYHCNLHHRSPILAKHQLTAGNGFFDRNYDYDEKCCRYVFRYNSRAEIYAWQVCFINYTTQWNVIVCVDEILWKTVVDDH